MPINGGAPAYRPIASRVPPIYEPAAPFGVPNLREACGVVAVYGPDADVAALTYGGLYAVQHRGQESAGITIGDGHKLHTVKDQGLISQVFIGDSLTQTGGKLAIGHCRYSTSGSNSVDNVQPALQDSDLGPIAVAHNGNIVNALQLRDLDEQADDHTGATSDTAVIARAIAGASGRNIYERVQHIVPRLLGSFCLVVATPHEVVAARDAMGNRPLCLGTIGNAWVIASETCALDAVGANLEREIEPGEVLVIGPDGLRSTRIQLSQRQALCAFEYIYFTRPDSTVKGSLVHSVRREMGRLLALQDPVEADLVIGVPDSAIAAATGYAEASGLPYADGFVRNRYIGRTFIEPSSELRKLGVRLKYGALPGVTRGKRVVMVDDSIVRGTSQMQLVKLMRDQGEAREVHVRITAPPIRWPCFLGIDIPDPDELIAHERPVGEICRAIGADSLEYLTVPNLVSAIGQESNSLCLGCFTRDYPIDVQLSFDKFALERPTGLSTAPVFPRQSALLPTEGNGGSAKENRP